MSVTRRVVGRRHLSSIVGLLLTLGLSSRALAQDPPSTTSTTDRTQGLLPEPRVMTLAADAIGSHVGNVLSPGDGFYVRVGSLVPSAGWLRGGPGYRHHFWENRALVDVSGAVSWRTYEIANARVELPEVAGNHLLLGTMGVWEDYTQIGYFGAGPNSSLSARTAYRLRASDASAYAVIHENRVFSIGFRGGLLSRPTISDSSGWHNPGYPSALLLFSDSTAPGLTRQPRFAHGDVSIVVDTRNSPGYPTSGTVVRLSAASYRDQDFGQYSFERYEFEAAQHVPLTETWTLGLHEGVVASEARTGNQVPFYFFSSLSSDTALRGYEGDRFQDRDLVVLNIESRWAIFPHMDGAVFSDIGQVAPTLGAIRTDDLRTTYGVGIRFHATGGMIGRLDVARGSEGWRIVGKLSDSLVFTAFQRWATILPIFP